MCSRKRRQCHSFRVLSAGKAPGPCLPHSKAGKRNGGASRCGKYHKGVIDGLSPTPTAIELRLDEQEVDAGLVRTALRWRVPYYYQTIEEPQEPYSND